MGTKIEWCDFRKGNARIHSHNGYFLVYCPGHPHAKSKGHIYEHRYLVEKYLERYLEKDEFVHHCNGDTSDNRIGNLDITLNSEHVSHHHRFASKELRALRTKTIIKAAKAMRKPRVTVKCLCGCGKEIETPNKWGRDKKYVLGHNRRGRHRRKDKSYE